MRERDRQTDKQTTERYHVSQLAKPLLSDVAYVA